ncbi:MAG TPA: DUF3088 family protein [Hellea balneolensis]|uniref:DUF3088 family protein n=1 Tax=Hellea balneolensis TaxID=287478 RepID=A0A7C3G615_9PROT|nr:DUF3088 family protein [Hellea balneolensis]
MGFIETKVKRVVKLMIRHCEDGRNNMHKPVLYLLAPGFEDHDRREYCPECAEMWGVLNYFPAIKEALEICYQPIARPRADLVKKLGDDNQNCPTLIFPKGYDIPDGVRVHEANGYVFLNNARAIGYYFSYAYGTPVPR